MGNPFWYVGHQKIFVQVLPDQNWPSGYIALADTVESRYGVEDHIILFEDVISRGKKYSTRNRKPLKRPTLKAMLHY